MARGGELVKVRAERRVAEDSDGMIRAVLRSKNDIVVCSVGCEFDR